jgi:hypothetical protein
MYGTLPPPPLRTYATDDDTLPTPPCCGRRACQKAGRLFLSLVDGVIAAATTFVTIHSPQSTPNFARIVGASAAAGAIGIANSISSYGFGLKAIESASVSQASSQAASPVPSNPVSRWPSVNQRNFYTKINEHPSFAPEMMGIVNHAPLLGTPAQKCCCNKDCCRSISKQLLYILPKVTDGCMQRFFTYLSLIPNTGIALSVASITSIFSFLMDMCGEIHNSIVEVIKTKPFYAPALKPLSYCQLPNIIVGLGGIEHVSSAMLSICTGFLYEKRIGPRLWAFLEECREDPESHLTVITLVGILGVFTFFTLLVSALNFEGSAIKANLKKIRDDLNQIVDRVKTVPVADQKRCCNIECGKFILWLSIQLAVPFHTLADLSPFVLAIQEISPYDNLNDTLIAFIGVSLFTGHILGERKSATEIMGWEPRCCKKQMLQGLPSMPLIETPRSSMATPSDFTDPFASLVSSYYEEDMSDKSNSES